MKKNNNPLVTIIVAIYNGEKYLNECVDSILSQTYKNLEIILVDDGSSDDCPKICDEYAKKDERIKVIHKENGGVSSARNAALEIIEGDYVCIIDQDDWVSDDYVEYLLGLIEKYEADVSVVPHVIYATKNRNIYDEKEKPTVEKVWSNEEAACEMLYSKMEISPWSKMVSKKVIDKNKIRFYLGIFGGEGYAFSVESFMAANKVAAGYRGVYYYRVDNYSSEMSKYRPRTLKSSLKAVGIMRDEFKGSSRALNIATKYAIWRVYVSFLDSLIASGMKKEYPEDYRVLVKNCRKKAVISLFADVSLKRKIKDCLYFISPTIVAKINVLRNKKRAFNKG